MTTTKFNLYNGTEIKFSHPEKFHLPRFVSEHGLKNYEPVSQAFFLASAERISGCIYDVGSNIGIYSLAVAATLRLPVYAYEPFEEAASVLCSIATDYNLPIYVNNCAVGDSDGVQDFYISTKSDMSNSLNPNFRSHKEVRTVHTKSIDSLSQTVRPGAIKIDVETTELQVLFGARATIQRDRPVLLMEVLSDEVENNIIDYISEYEYSVIKMGDRKLHTELGNVFDLDTSGDERNWLIIPKEFCIGKDFTDRARHYVELIRNASV